MPPVGALDRLETERLILRPSEVDDAATFRTMWSERDPRVPPHRRISSDGRPTVDDIAAQIRGEPEGRRLRLLTVERKGSADAIGYCGLTPHGNGSPDEPELAYELLQAAHGRGYATEAAQAAVSWAGEAGYQRLWAGVWDWNVASRRVLEKLGFCETGQVEPHSVHGQRLLTVRELEFPRASEARCLTSSSERQQCPV
ncbi:MAG TPA: GNAT family N-acetyltransferase [Microlunatus sp.]